MNKLKHGTVREDGRVFWGYDRGKEWWVTPKKFADKREKNNHHTKKWRTAWTPEQRKKYKQYNRKFFATMTLEQRKQRNLKSREYHDSMTPEQREKANQRHRKHYAAMAPEQRKQYKQKKREYRKQNPEIGRAHVQRRIARKLAQLHPELDRQLEEAIHAQCIHLTHTTGEVHHVDHIIPIACGGFHHHDNLQCLPAKLNLQKQDNPIWEHQGYKCWRDVPTHLWPEQLDKLYSSLLV